MLGPSRLSGSIRALPSFFPSCGNAPGRRKGGARSAPLLRTNWRHAEPLECIENEGFGVLPGLALASLGRQLRLRLNVSRNSRPEEQSFGLSLSLARESDRAGRRRIHLYFPRQPTPAQRPCRTRGRALDVESPRRPRASGLAKRICSERLCHRLVPVMLCVRAGTAANTT